MTLDRKLRHLMLDHDLSGAGLARRLGVTQQRFARWAAGETLPDYRVVLALARHFAVPLDWLLDDEAAYPPPAGTAGTPAAGPAGVRDVTDDYRLRRIRSLADGPEPVEKRTG